VELFHLQKFTSQHIPWVHQKKTYVLAFTNSHVQYRCKNKTLLNIWTILKYLLFVEMVKNGHCYENKMLWQMLSISLTSIELLLKFDVCQMAVNIARELVDDTPYILVCQHASCQTLHLHPLLDKVINLMNPFCFTMLMTPFYRFSIQNTSFYIFKFIIIVFLRFPYQSIYT
jgi:hypothetical protein